MSHTTTTLTRRTGGVRVTLRSVAASYNPKSRLCSGAGVVGCSGPYGVVLPPHSVAASDNPESPRCSNRKSSNTGWSLAACTSHPELESLPAEAGGLAACSGHDDSDIAGVCSWHVVLLDENSVGG